MPVGDTQLGALNRRGTRGEAGYYDVEESVKATFRRKYGIPPAGSPPKGGWPDSDYGFPLPPKGHPLAKKFARAVLSRAHQNGKFAPAALARQVRRAKAILGEKPAAAREAARAIATEIRSVETFLRESAIGTKVDAVRLRETTWALGEAKYDAEKGTAHVVLIRAGHGNIVDKHWYTETALRRAVEDEVFEGVQCHLDHPTRLEEQIQPERSVKSLAGFYRNCTIGDYVDPELGKTVAIYADFVPQAGEERVVGLLRTAEQYRESFPDKAYVGFSINALGGGEVAEIDGQRWNRVDVITKADSVDIVTRAGAGGKPLASNLQEAQMPGTKTRSRRTRESRTDGLSLVLNREKLAENLRPLRESYVDQIIAQLGDVSPEIQAKLTEARKKAAEKAKEEEDAADGDGPLEEAIEEAMDVAEGSTPDMDEAARERARERKRREAARRQVDNDFDATAPADGLHEDGDMDFDEADVDEMNPDEMRGHLKNLRRAFGTKVAEASARIVAPYERELRETQAKSVLVELNIPEEHRPRLLREFGAFGCTSRKAMVAHAREYDKLYIRAGGTVGSQAALRESGDRGAVDVPNFQKKIGG